MQLGEVVRGRINRLFLRFDLPYSTTDETGWNHQTSLLEDLERGLCDLYGSNRLPEGGGIHSFVRSGPAERVFDAVELYSSIVAEGSALAAGLNVILDEEEVPWRMLGGEMVLLDQAFARSSLAARADESIGISGFDGARLELRRSRHHLADGDGRAAVHRAGSAFESVMMALLEADRGKGAKLLQKLNQDGYFKDLPVRLRQPFIREVLESLPWMRNELGGHGQGEGEVEVPRPYAQLATDLAASFCHFLISLKLEQEGKALTSTPSDDSPELVAIPDEAAATDFSFSSGPEDDIPF